jgi:DNA/RNA endonuclease G (NUC1)
MRKFAIPFVVLGLFTLGVTGSRAQGAPTVFINEIHYDNDGTDTGEAIEIAGPAGTNLAGYSLVLYNGSTPSAAVTYGSARALAGVIPNEQGGYGTLNFTYGTDGIQNGGNDGIALVQGTSVIQLLSYEGAFTASNGPAAGMTSTNIGVSELGSTPVGQSLQLIGTGSGASAFSWTGPVTASPGARNAGQTFGAPADNAPSVSATAPAAGDSGVAVASTIEITFSESVAALPGAFAITCNAAPQPFTASASPAAIYTLTPSSDLPFSANCTVTVAAAQISDTDSNDPPDQMAASHSFSFDTAGLMDEAPVVTSAVPANGTENVPAATNIVINFSENVTASPAAFSLDCNGARTFSLSGSGSASLTIDPDSDLPHETTCTVTVTAASVFDTDTNDPPDQMDSDASVSFTVEAPPPPVAANVIINEVDSDQDGADAGEFIELYDGGVGNTSLTGLTVVFFNGSSDLSYAAFDLDGFTTDAAGYFTIGNTAVPGRDLVFAGNLLQNGADAVALYAANASDFPNNTAITQVNLQDAVVYDSDDADDPGLLALLNAGEPQVNENGSGNITGHSIGRCANGSGGARNTSSYVAATPSPGADNNCPPPPPPPSDSVIVISQVYGGGGNDGATHQNDYVELFNRGTVTVDTTGWSLQYAAATGSGWDFNKTPLGGPIAPGEYYLIKLASNGATGLALPAENVSGPINLSGTNGKVALVASFEALSGNCPTANPNVRDFVGYGTADCFEGAGAAPAPSVSTALLRNNGGLIDTDTNSTDLATGAPAPRRTAPIVELGPIVLSTDPSTNDTNVPRDPTVVVTFTEPVNVVEPWFDITCATSGQHNSHTLTGNGRVWNITPNVNLVGGEQCTMTIFAGQVNDQDLDDSAPNTDTLAANHTWSFLVASGTAPPYPASVHLTMGNPTNATADLGQPTNYLMEKPEFTLSYNRDLGRPNWVSWHLSNEWYGSLPRFDTFRADPQVPPEWYRVQGFDFTGSGFDRGHMVPNADRDPQTSVPINQATFLMTNMVAQAGGNNQGPWADMEAALRLIADDNNELYIVSGPEGVGGTGDFGGVTMTIANGHVTVPATTWKVALVLPKQNGDDLSRVTCATRTIAVIMPNVESIEGDDWQEFLTSVDAVEALTGYDLFSNLPDNVEYCVEAGINGENPAEDLEPPVVQCEAADGAWHADNVSLACTATDAGVGLANAADASFSLMTAVASGAESANAATDSRVVCDALGNCATAGPIAGNKIDRLGPAITLTTPASGATYQLNRVVAAAFGCVDGGAGVNACAGTVANGAAIDTASIGPKSFVVTATDAVGNTSSTTIAYSVAAGTISISNIPSSAQIGASFVPAFSYAGDGATSVTSSTPLRCSVSGGTVTFLKTGTCTLVAHAAGSATFDPATGPAQSFVIAKRTATISITNIPANATLGDSFTPIIAYTGNGTTHLRSETPFVCRVLGDTRVKFVGLGTCTLVAWATPSDTYLRADGEPQSFAVRLDISGLLDLLRQLFGHWY